MCLEIARFWPLGQLKQGKNAVLSTLFKLSQLLIHHETGREEQMEGVLPECTQRRKSELATRGRSHFVHMGRGYVAW